MSDQYDFELVPGVDLMLERVDDGVRVTVAETNDGFRTVFSSVESPDFFESQQKRGTIKNRLPEYLSECFNSDAVCKEFERLCSRLAANDIDDDTKEMMRPPVVRQLLNETDRVEVFGGDPTTITVTLSRGEVTRCIDFTSGEWVMPNPAVLKTKYYDQFYERLDLGKDEWNELTEAWEEEQIVTGEESMTEREAIIERVVSGLSARVKPVDTREVLENGTYSAWFDAENSACDKDVPTNNDVLWVKSQAITDQLDEAGKSPNYISELSKSLHESQMTFSTSKKKRGVRVYPFAPDALGITEWDVHSPEDTDQSEVQP